MEYRSIGAFALLLPLVCAVAQQLSRRIHPKSRNEYTIPLPFMEGELKQITPLIEATQNGDISQIESLLKRGVDVSESTENNITALWLSAAMQNTLIVKRLLEAGADTEVIGPAEMTPLMVSIQSGSVEITSLLLQYEAEIEARDSTGATPLIAAAILGHSHILELLIQSGANLEARRAVTGVTALWAASFQGSLSCVVKLVHAGADLESSDVQGATPLFIASQEGHQMIVQTLLQAGANPVASRSDGVTPLHAAAALCRKGVVELLLENGSNPVLIDTHGHLPVDYLNITNCKNAFELYSIEAMLRPIFHAAREGQDWQLKLMIYSGESIQAVLESNGMTPLHVAAAHGRKEVIQVLLEQGARLNHKDRLGRIPLEVLGTERKLSFDDRDNLTVTLNPSRQTSVAVPQSASSEKEEKSHTVKLETLQEEGEEESSTGQSNKGIDSVIIVMVIVGAVFGVSAACAVTAFFRFRHMQEVARLTQRTSAKTPSPDGDQSEQNDRDQSSFSGEGGSTVPPLRSEKPSTSRTEIVRFYSESSLNTLGKRQKKHSTLECASDVNCDQS